LPTAHPYPLHIPVVFEDCLLSWKNLENGHENGRVVCLTRVSQFPVDSHTKSFEARRFYKLDAPPVAEPVASRHRREMLHKKNKILESV